MIVNPFPNRTYTIETLKPQPRPSIRLYSVFPKPGGNLNTLGANEREHAQRINNHQARLLFICGRIALRKYLAPQVGCAANALRFISGDHGKPALCAHTHPESKLGFNITHCRDRIVIAIATDPEVGVDIECCDRNLDWEPIARRFFSHTEYTALLRLPQSLRQRAFIRTWVRKEALLKALGSGITIGLSRFDLRVDPTTPACLLRSEIPSLRPEQWLLTDVELSPLHFVAVATNQTHASVVLYPIAEPHLPA